jgi:hypothetical protein
MGGIKVELLGPGITQSTRTSREVSRCFDGTPADGRQNFKAVMAKQYNVPTYEVLIFD